MDMTSRGMGHATHTSTTAVNQGMSRKTVPNVEKHVKTQGVFIAITVFACLDNVRKTSILA